MPRMSSQREASAALKRADAAAKKAGVTINSSASDLPHRLSRVWEYLQQNKPLPRISVQQYEFCRNVVTGASFIAAYRKAFKASISKSDLAVTTKAAKLASRKEIILWINHIQNTEKQGATVTSDEQIAEMAKLKHVAVEAGDHASAIRAQTDIGKVSGLYIDRSITETTVTFTPTSLEQALIARNPALAERLRQARAIADSMDGEVPLLDLTPDVVSEPVSSSRKRDKT